MRLGKTWEQYESGDLRKTDQVSFTANPSSCKIPFDWKSENLCTINENTKSKKTTCFFHMKQMKDTGWLYHTLINSDIPKTINTNGIFEYIMSTSMII